MKGIRRRDSRPKDDPFSNSHLPSLELRTFSNSKMTYIPQTHYQGIQIFFLFHIETYISICKQIYRSDISNLTFLSP